MSGCLELAGFIGGIIGALCTPLFCSLCRMHGWMVIPAFVLSTMLGAFAGFFGWTIYALGGEIALRLAHRGRHTRRP